MSSNLLSRILNTELFLPLNNIQNDYNRSQYLIIKNTEIYVFVDMSDEKIYFLDFSIEKKPSLSIEDVMLKLNGENLSKFLFNIDFFMKFLK